MTSTTSETKISEVTSLSLDDNEEKAMIFIKHQDSETVWEIPTTAACHSKLIKDGIIDNNDTELYGKEYKNPMIIPNTVKVETIEFMVNYMVYYNYKDEKPAPASPLKDIHISVIFGDEYELFKDVCENKMELKEMVIYVNSLIESATYFGFKHLHKKYCAIVAYKLSSLSIEQLEKML